MGKKKGGPKKTAPPEAGDNNTQVTSTLSLPVTATPEPDAATPWLSRNKHWQYIASFQGRWYELPVEILESLANLNYNTPRPHPIDPALFYDVVKIRKLVDSATDQALRAASGTVSTILWNQSGSHQRLHGEQTGREITLSSQRQLKMRETATENLAKAYRLDEIACSVAVMKGSTCLEEVASHVLKRQPENLDALYVHFLHEKIPSRYVPKLTALAPLDIVVAHSLHPEPSRTRGVVKMFKDDDEGALEDIRRAISLDRSKARHGSEAQQLTTRGQDDMTLKEDEQPSSLGVRLVFHKASAHLKIAIRNVNAALPPAKDAGESQESPPTKSRAEGEPPETSEAESESQKKMMEARKLVKDHARRALRGFMEFLSHFEYTPDWPLSTAIEFCTKANYLIDGHKKIPRGPPKTPSKPRIYKIRELFINAPPADLPPLGTLEQSESLARPQESPATMESITFHPLLAEALHLLLLSHCLVQTSAKELHRHACMVVRLSRLCSGFPVFQTRRPLARTDWVEILRGGDNWINFEGDWDELCEDAPKREEIDGMKKNARLLQKAASKLGSEADEPEVARTAVAIGNPWYPSGLDEHERMRIARQARIEASADERVTDNETFNLATRARELRALRDAERRIGVAKLTSGASGGSSYAITDATAAASTENVESTALVSTKAVDTDAASQQRRSSFDIRARNFPIATDRAQTVIRWVLEAPPHPGVETGADGVPKKTKKKNRAN